MNTTRPIGQSQTMKTLQTIKRRGWRAAAVLCSALALSACASSLWTPDAQLGQAVRQAQQVQTIDPYAALQPDAPVIRDDLAGKTVAVTRGAIEDQELTKVAPAGAELKRFEDNNATVSAYVSGQTQLLATGASCDCGLKNAFSVCSISVQCSGDSRSRTAAAANLIARKL